MKTVIVLMLMMGSLSACGSAKAGNARAETVPGPAGVTCYIVRDYDGNGVGGNCLPTGTVTNGYGW